MFCLQELLPAGPGEAAPLDPVHGAGPQQGLAGLQEQDPHPGPAAHVCGEHAGRPSSEGESGPSDGLAGGRGLGLHQVVLSLPIFVEI